MITAIDPHWNLYIDLKHKYTHNGDTDEKGGKR